jgi:hypothetical protein
MQGYNLHNPKQTTRLLHGDEQSLRNWCKFTSQDFCGAFAYGETPAEFWVDGRRLTSRAAANAAAAAQIARD